MRLPRPTCGLVTRLPGVGRVLPWGRGPLSVLQVGRAVVHRRAAAPAGGCPVGPAGASAPPIDRWMFGFTNRAVYFPHRTPQPSSFPNIWRNVHFIPPPPRGSLTLNPHADGVKLAPTLCSLYKANQPTNRGWGLFDVSRHLTNVASVHLPFMVVAKFDLLLFCLGWKAAACL